MGAGVVRARERRAIAGVATSAAPPTVVAAAFASSRAAAAVRRTGTWRAALRAAAGARGRGRAGRLLARHAGRIDFDDLLVETIDLLESDPDAAATVRARKRWLSVDEYQDTNPLQQRLLELWLGDSRDLCVVGDEDQSIYTFTGATSRFLTGFAERYPDARVVTLADNFRSTPEVLELANRLLASTGRSKRLVATRGSGPVPTITRHHAKNVKPLRVT